MLGGEKVCNSATGKWRVEGSIKGTFKDPLGTWHAKLAALFINQIIRALYFYSGNCVCGRIMVHVVVEKRTADAWEYINKSRHIVNKKQRPTHTHHSQMNK